MHKIIKAKFIRKYWVDIIETDNGFSVFNTQRRKNQIDRDGIGYEIAYFKTREEAEQFLQRIEDEHYEL